MGKARRFSGILTAVLAFALGHPQAEAVPILDQEMVIPTTNGANIGPWLGVYRMRGQTFVPSMSGQLASIDMHLGRTTQTPWPVDVTLTVTETTSGFPTGTPLGSALLELRGAWPEGGGSNQWYSFDLQGEGIHLDAGETYAFYASIPDMASPPLDYGVILYAVLGDHSAYPSGYAIETADGGPWDTIWGDFHFRTFMELGTIPEPTTMSLLAAGLTAVRLRRKRRRNGR